MAEATASTLWDCIAGLEDAHQQAKVLYPLPEIPLLAGALAGADEFIEISLWGEASLSLLRPPRRRVNPIPLPHPQRAIAMKVLFAVTIPTA